MKLFMSVVVVLIGGYVNAEPIAFNYHTKIDLLSYLNDVAPLHPNGGMAYFEGPPPQVPGTGTQGIQLAFSVNNVGDTVDLADS